METQAQTIKERIRAAYAAKQAQSVPEIAAKLAAEDLLNESEQKEQRKRQARDKFSEVKSDSILKDLNAELVGTWVWVDADKTGAIATALKAKGFGWSFKRQRWCYSPAIKKLDHRKQNRRATMEGIRSKYGSRWGKLEELTA